MTTTISGSTGINKIQDGTIVNADINASAAIAGTKLTMPAGSVLQVVTATTTTAVTFSASTYSSAGLAVTVTPKRVNSKFIIQIWGRSSLVQNSSQTAHDHRVLRDSTGVNGASWQNYFNRSGIPYDIYPPFDVIYTDTPATLNAITYSLEGRIYAAAQGGWTFAAANGGNAFGIMTITEIAQ